MKRMASDEVERLQGLRGLRIKRLEQNSELHNRLFGQHTRSTSAKGRRDPRERLNKMHGEGAAAEDETPRDSRFLTEPEAEELVRRLTERNTHRPNCRCYACEVGEAVSHIKTMKVKKPRRSYSRSKSRSRSQSRSGRRASEK